jgi:Do/DeqQ family serine protease
MSFLNKFRPRKLPLVGLVLTGILIGFGLAFLGFSLSSHGPDRSIRAETPGSLSDQSPEVSQAITQATSVQSAFRYVAQTVLPSVVEIDVTSTKKASDSKDQQNPWKYFFGQPEDGSSPDQEYQEEGLGSGIIVKRDGKTVYVLTNNHVAGDADKDGIKVILVDGREFPATLVGADTRKDIAVVKFETEDKDIVVAKLGNSSALEVGDWAIAVGNPFGFSSSVTIGVVSAIGRTGGPDDNISDFIQTDAAINKGNSGGALVNIRGEVVGMNTWIASPTGGSIGLGFAIPIDRAKKAIEDLIGKGKVEYGWLGIQMPELDKASAAELGLDGKKGAFVAEVYLGSPAQKSGILPGDVIVKANGADVKAADDIVRLVSDMPAGQSAMFTVVRDGKQLDIRVVIEARKDSVASNDANLFPGMTAISLKAEIVDQSKLPKGVKGIIVTSVFPKTPAAVIGLKPGDIVTEVNEKPCPTLRDFYRLLNDPSAKKLAFTVFRDGETVTTLAYVRK